MINSVKITALIKDLLILGLLIYLAWPKPKVDNSVNEQILLEVRQANEENRQRDSVNHELLITNNQKREADRIKTNKQRDENIKKLSSPDLTNDELRRMVAE